MRKFAWLTFFTGLALSGVAAYYSVIGLAMVFAGAFMPVVILASLLELSKLVAVSWMYRYRQLAGWIVRTYFYAAILVLMSVTSMGIFGYLTRAHVETEGTYTTAQLTLQEIQQREAQLQDERTQIQTELKTLNEQSNQLVSQLGAAQRLNGSQGAVNVQRQTTARRSQLLTDLKRINADLTTTQKERIATEADTMKATADIGPLRYVAQTIYGADDVATVRKAVIALTAILMVVFDPMAIMLLIAANILFVRTTTPVVETPQTAAISNTEPPRPDGAPTAALPTNPDDVGNTNPNSTDVPNHLLR